MKLGTFLLSLLEPALSRIFVALGLSVVSITGMQAIFQQLKVQLATGVNSLPSDALQLFLIAGGGEGLGILLGAITTRLMLWQVQKSTQFLGKSPT